MNKINKDKSLRLREIREKVEMTQAEMAKIMNLELGSYRNKEYGKDKLTDKNLSILYEKLNIRPDFILNGTGEMFENGKNPINQNIEFEMLNELIQIEGKVELLASFATDLRAQIRAIINKINKQSK